MARNMTSQVKVLQFLSKVVPFPVDGNRQMYVVSLKKGKSLILQTTDPFL